MEAIEHNPVVYELMNEVAWHSAPLDVPRWLRGYVVRRYGADDDDLQSAWQLLHRSAYATNVFAKSYMEAEPMIEMQRRTIGWFWMHSEHRTAAIDATTIVEAWRALARAAERGVAPRNGPFEYDLVDLTRQVMANLFFDAHVLFEYHFHAYIKAQRQRAAVGRAHHVDDADDDQRDRRSARRQRQLSARALDRRGALVERAARRAGALQFNAMNLITLWGPEGEINDYSTRPWSGLYSSYYYERWKLLFDRVVHLLRTGKPVGGYRTALQTMRRSGVDRMRSICGRRSRVATCGGSCDAGRQVCGARREGALCAGGRTQLSADGVRATD
jgi:alpha-N-acetylglucosaminidase